MAFTRIRTIKGRQYRYLEERWREGGKVRSRSTSLGPASGDGEQGFIRRQFPRSHGIDWDAIERQELARMKADDERRADLLLTLYQSYGLKLGPPTPVPEEKIAAPVDRPSEQAMPASEEVEVAQENTSPGGEVESQ